MSKDESSVPPRKASDKMTHMSKQVMGKVQPPYVQLVTISECLGCCGALNVTLYGDISALCPVLHASREYSGPHRVNGWRCSCTCHWQRSAKQGISRLAARCCEEGEGLRGIAARHPCNAQTFATAGREQTA
eukprot:4593270-Amphidinium_carterae.1